MSEKLSRIGTFILFFIFVISLIPAYAQSDDKDRSKIADSYKWNLNEIYPSLEAWQKDKDKISNRLPEIEAFKGKLSTSGQELKKALDALYQIQKEFSRAYVYASMLSDEDTRQSVPQGMKQEMQQLGTEFSKVSAYIDPEILSIPQEKMDRFFKEEPGLETYRHVIDNIQRSREHILNPEQEAIIAEAGRMSGTAQATYSMAT